MDEEDRQDEPEAKNPTLGKPGDAASRASADVLGGGAKRRRLHGIGSVTSVAGVFADPMVVGAGVVSTVLEPEAEGGALPAPRSSGPLKALGRHLRRLAAMHGVIRVQSLPGPVQVEAAKLKLELVF